MGGSESCPGHFTPGKEPVPIVQEAGWAPGLVWTGAENLAPNGIRSQTAQPVASHYTDSAIAAHHVSRIWGLNFCARFMKKCVIGTGKDKIMK